jgi:hypothetical protein
MVTLLEQYGHKIMVDGTFETVELGLVLSTILIEANGLAVPTVWLLADRQTTETYEWFFRYVLNIAPMWELRTVYADFDSAVRAALRIVFEAKGVLFFGDSFHFFYDNRKWARTHGGSQYPLPAVITISFCCFFISFIILIHVDVINDTLHMLYLSPSVVDFNDNLACFLDYWTRTWPAYASYFAKQWVNAVGPSEWAHFARPHDGIFLFLISFVRQMTLMRGGG